jgi:hypothetical protein
LPTILGFWWAMPTLQYLDIVWLRHASYQKSFRMAILLMDYYSGFRSYEVHLSPLIACGLGVGFLYIAHNIGVLVGNAHPTILRYCMATPRKLSEVI